MRVLVAPDCFGGTLSALQAAQAVADGWRATAPGDVLDLCPLADGGPGLLEVLQASSPDADVVPVVVRGPLGEPVPATLLLHDGTAWVESALACGLHLVPPRLRDPLRSTTYGAGQLVLAALDAGAHRVVVGLGGSATHDGGAGALAALGVVAHAGGAPLPPGLPLAPGGAALAGPVRLAGDLDPQLGDVDLVVATDVDVPLAGAAAFFAQKRAPSPFPRPPGVDDAPLPELDAWADALQARFGVDVRHLPGAGAAGGLGAALLAVGARRAGGLALVADVVRLRARLAAVDLVVTGEGSFDATSLLGKATGSLAALAQEAGVPCLVLAGQCHVGRREAAARGVDEAMSVVDLVGLERALVDPAGSLRALAARAARSWSV